MTPRPPHPKTRTVTVHDRMQDGYRYTLTAPMGRGFAPDFRPQLTPKEMLTMGVFGGLYMTDCRREFPASWFAHAKLAPAAEEWQRAADGRRSGAKSAHAHGRRHDPALNFFHVNASQPLAVWRAKGLINADSEVHVARMVPVVLPLLYGSAAGSGHRARWTRERG